MRDTIFVILRGNTLKSLGSEVDSDAKNTEVLKISTFKKFQHSCVKTSFSLELPQSRVATVRFYYEECNQAEEIVVKCFFKITATQPLQGLNTQLRIFNLLDHIQRKYTAKW